MKMIIAIVGALIVAGAKLGSASGLDELRASCGSEPVVIAAPAMPASAPDYANFDVRKVFLMPEKETWAGPFAIQFIKGADRAAVLDILKRTGLVEGTKELADSGHGFYARIAMDDMDDEFAWVKIMRLTDYTSVAYVSVNKRLWTK